MIKKIAVPVLFGALFLFQNAEAQKNPSTPPKPQISNPATAQPNEKVKDPDGFQYPIYQTKLENGLNVVTIPFPSPGIVSFFIVVRTGSRNEIEKGKTGFAHFFEHMMFRGTELFPKEKYSEALKLTGASANANTSLDRTVYHMTGASSKLSTMFMLEADRFQHLAYSLQGFKTEAGAVKGEYTKNSANPYVKLNELIQNAAFDQHTYKHTTMGFFEDIVDMPNQYEYSREFFSRYYRPEYCTIIVVGDAKAEDINILATKFFGNWIKGSYVSTVPIEPAQTGTRFTHLQKAGFPPYLSFNFKGPGYDPQSGEMAAIDVLLSAYFGDNSDLYNQLVIKDQTLRNLSGDASLTRDPYLLSIEASLVNIDQMKEIKDKIEKTLAKAKTTPIDQKSLNEVKANFINSMKMRLDNPTAIAQTLSMFTWVTGNPGTINDYFEKYNAVTAKEIMDVANKYFTTDRLTIGTIGPNEKVEF